jgi:hypothetical protein
MLVSPLVFRQEVNVMARLGIVAVGLALVVAGVFAIWPVVGGAPWLSGEEDSSGPVEQPLLSLATVREAVKWHVTYWCVDHWGTKEERVGGTCDDEGAWATDYDSARRVWSVSCGGWQYIVDDTSGDVSSPHMPGMSGIDSVNHRLSMLQFRVANISGEGWRVDDLESSLSDLESRIDWLERRADDSDVADVASRVDDLESCLSRFPSLYCSARLNDIEGRLDDLE